MKVCAACCIELPREKFSNKQWNTKKYQRRCIECIDAGRSSCRSYIVRDEDGVVIITLNEEEEEATPNECDKSLANTTSTTNCAQCGKEGGNLNTCNKCNMVKYCNAACKKKHRSKHKKACERRVAELHNEALFKEHPPREDCPVCLIPLPLDPGQATLKLCCGKIICSGCNVAMMEEEARERRGEIGLCAFCRTLATTSNEEIVKRLKKLMEAENANAFDMFGGYYVRGDRGMPQDYEKANELRLRAGELGCAVAYHNLGNSYNYGRGVDMDKKKAKHYWELAAINGCVGARHNLGYMEVEAGNYDQAFKHFILSAKAGHKNSLDNVKVGFMHGDVTKDDYANTLRAYQSRHDEMKSEDRDKAELLRQSIHENGHVTGEVLNDGRVNYKT